MANFQKELRHLLNSVSAENESNTPDFILAEYLGKCLDAFNSAVIARDKWYDEKSKPKIVATEKLKERKYNESKPKNLNSGSAK